MIDPLLQERLNAIPHLDLGISFDLQRLREEAAKITHYVGYETVYGKQFEDLYRKSWQGRSLIGYEADSRKGMHEITPQYWEELQSRGAVPGPTDLAVEVPYMMDVIHQLDAQHGRARIMTITQGTHLAWHSHVEKHGQSPAYMTVHVPIEVPEGFTYEVTKKENLDRIGGVFQPLDLSAIYAASYPVARATCFNSYHYHNVFNRNPAVQRISIMIYMDLTRPIPRKIFESAVDSYRGPLIA